MNRTLHIDIETYSGVDLKKSGLYKYVQSPDFQILLFAFAYDDEPVRVIDMAQGEKIPYFTQMDLHRSEVKKIAHNAAFEFNCLSKFFETHIEQWECTMFHALYCGYPASLSQVGDAMKFPNDKKKSASGKALIHYFCKPCSPTQKNGGRTRNLPTHDIAKWNLFKEYCVRDVVTEREINNRLNEYPIPEQEQDLWVLDQIINATGVEIDTELVSGALAINEKIKGRLTEEARGITGLENPNSVAQLKQWIVENSGLAIEGLDKEAVKDILDNKRGTEQVQALLKIRQELAKTSIKKYASMEAALCDDGRIRGLLQFYGANRTGRWAGRLVQVQNLPRNYLDTLDVARDLVKGRNIDALRLIYGNIPDTLSQLIRTAFVPGKGCHFCVADFSAIEARVIAWLAGEQWRMDVFRSHGKIYEASASAMFGVPIDKITKGNQEYALRARGKVAELALGYQGAKGALIQMGALDMGLSEEDLEDMVKRWRGSNKRIVDFWKAAQQYALEAVRYGTISALPCGVSFHRDRNYLFITLPSGRNLFYNEPTVVNDELGRPQIQYAGLNQTNKKWMTINTYGGKLVENIVQAVARDLLASAMVNLHREGYAINFHIHDEVICQVPDGSTQTLERAIELMCMLPPWAQGLPLDADGFVSSYYKKD